jgi:hypothetical protein
VRPIPGPLFELRKRSVPEATERIVSDLIRVEEIEQRPLEIIVPSGERTHHNVTDDDSRLKGCCRIRIAILCLMQ